MKGKKREIDYGRNVDKKIREKLFEIFCHRILNTILIITISVGIKNIYICVILIHIVYILIYMSRVSYKSKFCFAELFQNLTKLSDIVNILKLEESNFKLKNWVSMFFGTFTQVIYTIFL